MFLGLSVKWILSSIIGPVIFLKRELIGVISATIIGKMLSLIGVISATIVLLITGRFNIDYRKIPLSPEHLLFGLIITGRFKSIDGCITYSHRI
jgi:hypothetical protein